jgi:hypothetical protein
VIPENRIPSHPGVILAEEFLAPLGISQVALAAHLGVPVQRVNELVRTDSLRPRAQPAVAAGRAAQGRRLRSGRSSALSASPRCARR